MKCLMFTIIVFFCSVSYADDSKTIQKGKELTQNLLFDEALKVLRPLDPAKQDNSLDLLFYRACCNVYLLHKDEAIKDLEKLVNTELPPRYNLLVHKMYGEIQKVEEDSLDEISRLMTDSSRRLELGRHDKVVQDQQQLIIDKLSRLIQKIEKEQEEQEKQQQSKGASSSSDKSLQNKPMEDSKITQDKGKGDIDLKERDLGPGWGDLPPKERNEIVQKLGAELPYHYREAIDAYFRRMATNE